MTDIAANLPLVLQTIRRAAEEVGRKPQSVQLIGVTKYVEAERVRQALDAGLAICGENRLQEAQAKMEAIGVRPGVTWHFIGRLQRRKLKSVVGQFSLIHSMESIEQVEELDRRAQEQSLRQSILLQVNVGNESTKGGFSALELLEAMPAVAKFVHIKVCGLMAIPPWTENPEAMRPHFRKLHALAQEVKTLGLPGIEMTELSMGMSNDYPIAIQEGATMVRVGTALFGSRPQ
ncbi:YggS family pyridoxal phosphate-dependent enzyme [Candidatus Nitronereus thalassa]|uniref:Pyridoxal phosphate homeostasis protein n=1 Tax=Candidatus Nitronereus thalassa TaxID=3020898 RepID=A0ABU3KAB5_9BACT|nr:YggS family pyridoxal phosphate-dependent enzyme [Candidatus Nitronereus thalassa]MDT7043351.1 YggS family pyridoxal phosphate-dependent enzyme [Candidatus Nitronereus thalassa]